MTDLAERYGAPSRARRPVIVTLAVLLAAALLGWLAWTVFFHSRPEVTSQLVGFEVQGQHAASATFTVVRRDAGGPRLVPAPGLRRGPRRPSAS